MAFPAEAWVMNFFSAEVIPYGGIPWTDFCSQGHNDGPKFHNL